MEPSTAETSLPPHLHEVRYLLKTPQTAFEIAAALGVSYRTAVRYIEKLKQRGVKIQIERNRGVPSYNVK